MLLPLLLASAWAQEQSHTAPPADTAHGHAVKTTAEMRPSEFFTEQYSHLMPHALWTPQVSPDPETSKWFTFYNVNLFQIGAVLAIFVLFTIVRLSFNADRPSWIVRVFRGWCLWIRDEMILPTLGPKYTRKLAPYFIFLFFFIAFLNLVSLIPGSTTAMATIFVTAALALQTLALIVWMGIKEQGVGGFIGHLVAPPGVPAFVLPIMAPVEILSLFVKPMALMIRLFANLLAGHMVLYSFIGMIFVFAKLMGMSAVGYLTAVPALGLAIFVNILEGFIVLLQAYVFTYLSLIFVGQMVHHHEGGQGAHH